MKDRSDHRTSKGRCDAKNWTAPQLRSVVPARRTRGGSGEQNGDVDDIVYDLS
ncbi:hypothetical protein [Sphingopyxis sp. QXT-31]|uniref:hypothetical protein n=1 Tax=Sphingopyxis sp. QXT-31 TaxID=1357916 RepID=UPI0012EB77F6|nr:hypothetical protein [Sphingopyxis sp. QXT-31]